MPLTYIGLFAALLIVILYNTIKILQEYERGVIFFLGRFQTVKGPGLIILIPELQKMIKVDLRVMVLDVPTQDVISRDNVSVKVNAVIYFRVVDPEKAIIRVAKGVGIRNDRIDAGDLGGICAPRHLRHHVTPLKHLHAVIHRTGVSGQLLPGRDCLVEVLGRELSAPHVVERVPAPGPRIGRLQVRRLHAGGTAFAPARADDAPDCA